MSVAIFSPRVRLLACTHTLRFRVHGVPISGITYVVYFLDPLTPRPPGILRYKLLGDAPISPQNIVFQLWTRSESDHNAFL